MKEIKLTKGKVALVDDDLFEELSQYKWSFDGGGYPQRATKTAKGPRPLRMHRHILGLVGRQEADHKDLDKLNNQVDNLRLCSSTENRRNNARPKHNTSGYKGVCFRRTRNVFHAHINTGQQQKYIGAYATAEEAAIAYDKAALHYFGEFARLNFPLQEKAA